MSKIICLGIAVLDQIFTLPDLPEKAGKYFAHEFLEVGGGPASTAAVTAAKLGADVEFWGRVGDDNVGDRIVKELNTYGVNTQFTRRIKDTHSALSAVMVDQRGERLIINRANAGLDTDPSWLPLERIETGDVVLADSRWIQGAELILNQASEKGLISVLDADSTPNDDISSLVEKASHVAFSKNGLREYTGETDFESSLYKASSGLNSWVCATDGARGTFWFENNEFKQMPAFKVNVVDTLGAGDVFHGALAYSLSQEFDIEQAIRFSNAVAAIKCTKLGGRAGIPSRTEVDHFLTKRK
ncbi:MAG: PfkB family carbohydrate kinase [Proteobacteria bacterium]|nr:PfkB family carbohydrate kinase [Pseudomonadota bacterium]